MSEPLNLGELGALARILLQEPAPLNYSRIRVLEAVPALIERVRKAEAGYHGGMCGTCGVVVPILSHVCPKCRRPIGGGPEVHELKSRIRDLEAALRELQEAPARCGLLLSHTQATCPVGGAHVVPAGEADEHHYVDVSWGTGGATQDERGNLTNIHDANPRREAKIKAKEAKRQAAGEAGGEAKA